VTFLDPWTTAYEGIPADSENINLGANRIRDLKVNVRQRGGADHSWGDTADNGHHNVVTYNRQAADPATVSSTGYLYTKQAGAQTELFWKDDTGHVVQLTSVGLINVPPGFPSGTVLSFLQATPPAGWTQYGGWGDAVVRLVNDTSGGAVGGSWTISGCTVGTTVSTSVSTSTVTSVFDAGSTAATGVTVVGTGLSQDQVPPHQHEMLLQNVTTAGVQAGGSYNTLINSAGNSFDVGATGTGNGLFGNAHSHGASASTSLSLALGASSSSSSSASSPASSTFSSNGSWRPVYVNACVGVKT